MFLVDSPLPFKKGERIEVRGFLVGHDYEAEPSPYPSLVKGEAEENASQIIGTVRDAGRGGAFAHARVALRTAKRLQ